MLSLLRNPANLTGAERVSEFLKTWSRRARGQGQAVFVLDEARMSDADVGRDDMLLPLFLWHADTLYRYAIAPGGLGAEFNDDAAALLGCRARIEPGYRSMSEILLWTLEAAEDAREHLPKSAKVHGACELRPLVNAFAAARNAMSAPRPEVRAEKTVPASDARPRA